MCKNSPRAEKGCVKEPLKESGLVLMENGNGALFSLNSFMNEHVDNWIPRERYNTSLKTVWNRSKHC